MPSDEELIRAFAGGSRDALGTLAQRYERKLLDLSQAILGSAEMASDAVQETWLRVVRYARSFNGRSSAKTWLYRIAINQCRSALSARPTTEEDVGQTAPDVSNEPSERAAMRDETERLKRAVERLSPLLRETVLLCYTHGLTHEEAAEAMGVPIGTVKSRVHAALEDLRTQLGAAR
jgi:RNA polymerase sigma-70 factor, ECF subfamily